MVDGGWGDEEKDADDFPFGPKASFEIRIVCAPDRFVVSHAYADTCGVCQRGRFLLLLSAEGSIEACTNFQSGYWEL